MTRTHTTESGVIGWLAHTPPTVVIPPTQRYARLTQTDLDAMRKALSNPTGEQEK